jgi:hypothetical protein
LESHLQLKTESKEAASQKIQPSIRKRKQKNVKEQHSKVDVTSVNRHGLIISFCVGPRREIAVITAFALPHRLTCMVGVYSLMPTFMIPLRVSYVTFEICITVTGIHGKGFNL